MAFPSSTINIAAVLRLFADLRHPPSLALLLGICFTVGCARTESAQTRPLERLKSGNSRFSSDHPVHPHFDADRRHETALHGQHPFATIVACSDSRVPTEIVFDQGLGDLFVIRIAGNVIATDEAGSIEYAVEHLHTPLLVVLGHDGCGAVTAVVKGAHEHGSIPKLVEHIAPAVATARKHHPGAGENELIRWAVEENVRHGIEDLLTHSAAVRAAVRAKSLEIVGAVYDLDTGSVRWMGRHPNESLFLEASGDTWDAVPEKPRFPED